MTEPRARADTWTIGSFAFALLLAITLLKGIRMPSRWAVTHYLFSYELGFMKRAFWGEILRRVFGSWTANYFTLAFVGFAVLAAFVTLIVWRCRKLGDAPERVRFLLVFLALPSLSFAAHLVGYLEQIAYLALAIVLVQSRPRVQLALALTAALLVPLVHEAAIVWVGPLIALVVLVGPATAGRSSRMRVIVAGAVLVMFVAATAFVLVRGQVTPERANAVREKATAYFEFRPRQDAFQTLTIPLRDSLRELRGWWARTDVQIDMAASFAVFAPGAMFLAAIAFRRARANETDRAVRLAMYALIGAAIAGPLLLHFVGRDGHRWNALAALNAGLAALTVLTSRSAAPVQVSATSGGRSRLGIALALCLWGVSADPVFFDAYGPNHAPFASQIRFVIDAVRTGNRSWWLPEQGR